MKRYNLGILKVLLALVLLASCSDEELARKGKNVPEGIPVSAKLSFAKEAEAVIETRAQGESGLSEQVSDLYVLIFNKDGKRIPGDFYFSDVQSSTSIEIETTTGERYIYGIANLSTNLLSVTKEELDNITTKVQLEELPMKLAQQSVDIVDGKFLMSGFFTTEGAYDEDSPLCAIDENGSVSVPTTDGPSAGKIWLKRLQSRVKFVVSIAEDKDVISFTPESFALVNVPEEATLYDTKANTQGTFFTVDYNQDIKNNTFSFYMLQNRQQMKGYYPEDAVSNEAKYELRSKKDPEGSKEGEGEFVYAPDHATYVKLKGHYKGYGTKYQGEDGDRKPGDKQLVDADVTYYIHLGYVGNDATDFSSLRNKDYTYKVTVEGVNSIILEVEEGKDYPRGGGNVYYTDGGNVKDVDAHYASIVLKFTKEMLGGISDAEIKVLVNSNLTAGFEAKDYSWLSFVEGGEEGKPIRYPGAKNDKLMDVDRFIASLKAFKGTKDTDAVKYYTCFVNEYYPIGTDNDWSNYVNKPDRIAQIICHTRSGSDSNTIEAAYVIRQKSILSFYDVGAVNTAWGIESINETTNKENGIEVGLEYGTLKGSSGTSLYNGRYNMITELGGSSTNRGDWYVSPFDANTPTYIDYREALKKAYAACMQRNRDEDGNGVISDDEIKWYLPAIYQYTDMSIGMNVLSPSVQLYSDDDYKQSFNEDGKKYWMFKHFVSNSGKKVFWAEEGGSYGAFGNSGDGKISKKISTTSRQLRCVRNLGTSSNKTDISETDYPQDFVSYKSSVMDLKNINSAALRSSRLSSGELGRHDERDIKSRPYSSFRVAKQNVPTYSYSFKQGGNYALSDRNGYYYVLAEGDKIEYGKGTPDARAYVDNGPYQRPEWDNKDKMTWKGLNKGNAMWSDKNGYYWKSVNGEAKGEWKQTTANTFVYVGDGHGIYELGPSTNSLETGWATQNQSADKTGRTACSDYWESPDKSDLGTWRLPNMRELLLMISKSNGDIKGKLMSRTYYSFYLNDIINNGYTQKSNGELSGYSIYSPGNDKSREGYAHSNLVYLIDPKNETFSIRCVKDE